MYNLSENSKSRMQRFEEPHAARESQFGHPCSILTMIVQNLYSV